MAGVNRRKHFRHALLAVAAAAALGASGPAAAMPPLLVAAGVAVGAVAMGSVATFLGFGIPVIGLTVGQVIFAGSLAYGVYQAHEARKDARRAYNNSLQDRNVTLYGGEVPWQIIYGEAPVKPAVAAILTSGDRDEYKHVVTVWANHECEGCTDVRIAGESIGPLDVNGWVTTGKWATTETTAATATVVLDASGNGTLPHAPLEIFDVQSYLGGDNGFEYATPTYTPGNPAFSVAGWGSRTVTVSYTRATSNTRVRVRHFNGSPDQVADPVLMALLPTEWTASDRLRGMAYSIWTFDLNEPELQGGIPELSAVWRGKKLYDPRTGLTAWSANNALCVRDFLRAEYGKRCTEGQVTNSSFGTAANACDEALVEFDGAPRYTCNGAFRTDEDPDQVLRQLLQSMGGTATFAGTWHVTAGVYTAPVMDLTDADNAGAVESIPSPTGLQVFNGLRGKFYDPDKADQRTDYPPYSNTAFVAEDGGALWSPLDLPFTNEAWRCHNLARIFVERSRAEQLTFPAKLRALRLRCGQRVRLTNSYLGFTNAVFRVIKKEWAPGQPVTLLLQQDDATWWDTVDAPATTPPAADNNPDPWVVAAPEGVLVESGNGTALISADRTILSRVRVTLAESADTLVREGGALEVEYRLPGDTNWTGAPDAPGHTTQVWLQGLLDDRQYIVRLRWRNALGALSDWVVTSIVVRADLLAPAAPADLAAEAVPAGLRLHWTQPPESDYLETEIKVGALLSTAVRLWVGVGTEHTWVPPMDDDYTFWVVHRDTSLNESDPTSLEVSYVAVGGASGGSSAQVFLYQRTGSATAPALPAVDLTYTFSTGLLSGGSLGLWSQTLPSTSGGAYLHATSAPAYSTTDEALIETTAWATARVLARDGADGDGVFVTDPGFESGGVWALASGGSIVSGGAWEGAKCLQVAYTGGGSAIHATNKYFPVVAGASYRLGAAVKQGSPAGNGTLYVRIAWRDAGGTLIGSTAVGTTAAAAWTAVTASGTVPSGAVQGRAEVTTASMTSGAWLVDAITVEPQGQPGVPGDAGDAGANGTSVAELMVYRRAASAPAAPTGGSFNFTTQVLTAPASWSVGIPAGTDPVYAARGIAATATPGSTVTPSWGAAALTFTDGQAVDAIFRRSATQPATPSASAGVPSGWYSNVADVPASSSPMWSSFGRRASPSASWVWLTPVRVEGQDGAPGDPGDAGADGTQVATAYLYQWSAATPANPSGGSTFTWASGAHGSYTGGGGWSVSVPPNPGTAGVQLWVCSKAVSAAASATSSAVSWTSGYSKYAVSGNGLPGDPGDPGTPGVQVAQPTLWRWALSIPTISGSNGYTWATGAITGTLPAGWSLAPGSGSPGQTLWAAARGVVGAAGDVSASIDWTSASITARGYAGADGADGADGSDGATGQTGISARRAYTLTTLTSLGSGTVTSTGISSLPAAGSFGAGTWAASPSTPTAGQVLYQSDGLYNPATNTTTWETPYISALKVGQLSALAVNTGDLTVNGQVTTTGDLFSSGFTSGSAGWRIRGNGSAEFNNVVARGGLYTNYGEIGGAVVTTTYVQSADYVPNTAGWRLSNGDGTLYANSALLRNADASRVFNLNATGTQAVLTAPGIQILANGSATFSGALSAATGTFGALTVAAGGNIKSGQTAYNTGTGFWLGLDGATPKFSIGNSAGNRVTWDGSALTVVGAAVSGGTITNPDLTLPGISASLSGGGSSSVAAGGTAARTVTIGTPSGGKSPYTYKWSSIVQDQYGTVSRVQVTGSTGTSCPCSMTSTGSGFVSLDVSCVVTDANGLTKTVTTSVNLTVGSPIAP